jgi:hypothetical protein
MFRLAGAAALDTFHATIGETGFEPATARPPAEAIQAHPVRFSALKPFQLL